MPDFTKLIGIAAIMLAVISPIAYCEIQTDASKMALKKQCAEVKGEWTNTWDGAGPRCVFRTEAKSS